MVPTGQHVNESPQEVIKQREKMQTHNKPTVTSSNSEAEHCERPSPKGNPDVVPETQVL